MKRLWRRFPGSTVLLAVMATLAWGDSVADEAERNARRLEQWRAHPDEYARLLDDFRAFEELPPERREQLRDIHRAVQGQDAAARDRQLIALERYAAWRDTLTEDERRQLDAAGDGDDWKRTVVRLREEQFVRRMPPGVRDRLTAMKPEERRAELARLREEEQQRRTRLQRELKPARPEDFPPDVRAFVRDNLDGRLGREDRGRLAGAEGKWPVYARTLMDLSDRYPVLPPKAGETAPTKWDELPKDVKDRLFKEHNKHLGQLNAVQGKWPDYALAVTRLAHDGKRDFKGRRVPPLGASRPEQFAPETKAFIEDRLYPVLSEAERRELDSRLGHWPEYPETLHELARKHRLFIPGMSLPGQRRLWESVRYADLPELPDVTLRQFALFELTPEDRAALKLSAADPFSRDRLREKYFERHPEELRKRRPQEVSGGDER